MRAYKFLDAHRCSPFTATVWVPGEWIEAPSPRPCHEGVHACHAADVSYWLADSMWEVELEGSIVESRHKVVGSRGRLVQPVGDYSRAARELAEVGVWRSRDRAVAALEAAGQVDRAQALSALTALDELAALGASVSDDWAGAAVGLRC